MSTPGEPLSTRLPAHAEHYARVESELAETMAAVNVAMFPHLAKYIEAGLPGRLLNGAVFRFETDRGKGKVLVSPTVLEGPHTLRDGEISTRIDVNSYHLSYEVSEGDQVARLGSVLSDTLTQHNPGQFEKYHGQKYLDNAQVIAEKLGEDDVFLMGVELRPLRPSVEDFSFTQALDTAL